jgi:hypothetical protein
LSICREALSRISPWAFVFLVPLGCVVSYALARLAAFIFRLGVRTAFRNPWRRGALQIDVPEQIRPGGRALVFSLAGGILLTATITLGLGWGDHKPEIEGEAQAMVREPTPLIPERYEDRSSVKSFSIEGTLEGSVAADPEISLAGPDPVFEPVSNGATPLSAMPPVPDSTRKSRPPSIDLLKLVDPIKDCVAGAWQFKEGSLVTTGRPFDRILIPYIPPEEYDIIVEAEREGGSNSLNLGLARGDVQFVVILDALINGEFTSGLDLIDGKPLYTNETTIKGALFENGKRNRVVCSVRASKVTVSVNGKTVIDWNADYRRLSLYKDWKVPHKDTLFIGTWTSMVSYHSLELRPVSGRGKALRGEAKKVEGSPSVTMVTYTCACGMWVTVDAQAAAPSCCGKVMSR